MASTTPEARRREIDLTLTAVEVFQMFEGFNKFHGFMGITCPDCRACINLPAWFTRLSCPCGQDWETTALPKGDPWSHPKYGPDPQIIQEGRDYWEVWLIHVS